MKQVLISIANFVPHLSAGCCHLAIFFSIILISLPIYPESFITVEVLIKLLESGLTAFRIHTDVIKITIPQNGGHFER